LLIILVNAETEPSPEHTLEKDLSATNTKAPMSLLKLKTESPRLGHILDFLVAKQTAFSGNMATVPTTPLARVDRSRQLEGSTRVAGASSAIPPWGAVFRIKNEKKMQNS
jgi:hypothetical protein